MRTIIALACLMITPLLGISQVKPIAEFYNKWKAEENVREIKIQGWLLKLASTFKRKDSEDLLNKVTYLRALIMEDGNTIKKYDYQTLIRSLENNSFETLIRTASGREYVDLLIREKGGAIVDAVVIVYGKDSFLLLSIEGKLNFKDLKKLDFDIDGAEHFKHLPENREDLPKV